VRAPDAMETIWLGGRPNQLSAETMVYPLIERIHLATKRNRTGTADAPLTAPPLTDSIQVKLPPPASSPRSFGEVARMRRSALDFLGGEHSVSLTQLSAILAAGGQPLAADFASEHFIQLFLYAHRVAGLSPGVYRVLHEGSDLEQIKLGDQRLVATALSLGQSLAGNACVCFSMVGDLNRAAHNYGDRAYRYVHFEAGAIGQAFYLAAESLGTRPGAGGLPFCDRLFDS
jgi:hypothetical protein